MKTIEIKQWSELPENFTGIVEYASRSSKHWYLNGLKHREDGPATEYADGDKYWYLNDKRHREDGPAIDYANGHKEYWFNGQHLPKKDINCLLDLGYPIEVAVKIVLGTHCEK